MGKKRGEHCKRCGKFLPSQFDFRMHMRSHSIIDALNKAKREPVEPDIKYTPSKGIIYKRPSFILHKP